MGITSQSGACPHTYMENWYFFIHAGSAAATFSPNKHLPLRQSATVLPCCRCEAWKRCFHPDWVRFPFDGGNVNVSFTPVLSFIMIKQFIPGERGGKRTACSGSIHRLSCFIHTLVILYHAPLSGRQEAGWHWNKSLIFCFLISFLLPVVSPISLFILHMWLPAC